MSPDTKLRSTVLALASLLALAACGPVTDEPTGWSVPSLETLTVESSTAGFTRDWDGVVSAERQAVLSAQTAGRVTAIEVDVGDAVSKGQSLLSISAVEQQAGVNAAAAQLEATEATLVEAELTFTRTSELAQRGLVARSWLDQASAARDSARAARDVARAQLARARQQTGYTDVVAPFDGVISARQVMPGEAVAPGSPLLTVVDPASLRVDVLLPQSVASGVDDAADAWLILADGSRHRPQRLIVFPVADARSHSVTVRAELPADAAGISPGQTLRLRLSEASDVAIDATIRIPESSVYRRGELTAVYVVGPKSITQRQLRLGRSVGKSVEALAGLRAGERIAVDPVAALAALKAQRRAAEASHD